MDATILQVSLLALLSIVIVVSLVIAVSFWLSKRLLKSAEQKADIGVRLASLILQSLLGITAIWGIYTGWTQLQLSIERQDYEKERDLLQRDRELQAEANELQAEANKLFNNALVHLSGENQSQRIGGIQSFYRLARHTESWQEKRAILEIRKFIRKK